MASSRENAQLKVFLIVILALAILAGGYLLALRAMGAPDPVVSDVPPQEQVTVIEGTYACLARKDKAQTKECSPGLKKDDGSFIALDLGEVIGSGGNANLANGTKITVGGEVVKIEDLSTDQWDVYDVTELMRVFEIAR